MGRFVVVGTPIGNLDDISPRAVKALASADVICCEDTRRTRKLLSALSIPAPRLVRLDEQTTGPVLSALEGGATVALATDAGMPAISDPGDRMVKAVAAAGYQPEVVPGPSAVTAALALSGLPASQFRFAGFLARKGRDRAAQLEEIASAPATVVIYESPRRVPQTVRDLAAACGPDRAFVAARELTKLHEEVWRGRLGDAEQRLNESEPRGEWVLLIGPAPRGETRAVPLSSDLITRAVEEKLAAGVERRQAIGEVSAELGVPKRQVYDVAVEIKHRS